MNEWMNECGKTHSTRLDRTTVKVRMVCPPVLLLSPCCGRGFVSFANTSHRTTNKVEETHRNTPRHRFRQALNQMPCINLPCCSHCLAATFFRLSSSLIRMYSTCVVPRMWRCYICNDQDVFVVHELCMCWIRAKPERRNSEKMYEMIVWKMRLLWFGVSVGCSRPR